MLFISPLKSTSLLTTCFLGLAAAAHAALPAPPLRSTYYNGLAKAVFPHRSEYDATVNMTVEAWVYRNASNSFHTIASHNWMTSWWLGISSGNRLRFYRSGGFPNYKDSTNTVPALRWTHVAATYDGSQVRFYIDGQPAGQAALSNAGANRSEQLCLGNDINGGLALNGYLDEVRLWSVVRTPSQIASGQFQEIGSATGLTARFPSGGHTNAYANVVGQATSLSDRIWGVLPRDYVVPRAQTAINYNSDLSEFTANNAERIIWRYRDLYGGERDVEGYLVYRDALGDHNLYIAVPTTVLRSDELGALQPFWFSFMVDTNASGGATPQTGDLRFDSRADNVSANRTNILRAGTGTGWANAGAPLAGSGSWDVVPVAGCEFDCARIFRIPENQIGGFGVDKRVLFGEFAYPLYLTFTIPGYSLPSPFDGDASVPDTWPSLSFGGASGTFSTATVSGRVRDVTAGAAAGLGGITVTLFNPNNTTVFASAVTWSDGSFSLNSVVYPADAPLRLSAGTPATGTWRHLTPAVSGNTHPVTGADRFVGVTYTNCSAGQTCHLGFVEFRLIEHATPTVTAFAPSSGTPHLVLRQSPLKATPATQFTLTGSNFHDFCAFYLSHQNCDWPLGVGDPLPTGPNCTNFPLRLVERGPDWTSVTLELDFDLALRFNVPGESWVRGPYRILVRDQWVGSWRASATRFVISDEAYPWIHGFEFRNERDGTQFDEFSGVYQWNAYDCITPIGPFPGANPCIGCRAPNPLYLTFYGLVFTPWTEAMTGSCLGMAATSLLLKRRELAPESFDSHALYAAGLPGVPQLATNELGVVYTNLFTPPKPQQHRFRFCDYSEPVNLWAHIHRNQAVQTSSEFLNNILSQMHGTGLAPVWRYSIDGNPTNVMERIRHSPFQYLLCFQNGGDVLQSHCVVPYRVQDGFGYDTNTLDKVPRPESSVIYVYDSNVPNDLDVFMEVDRAANTFRYFWGFRNVVEDGVTNTVPNFWSGTGCYATPISIWRTARTMPGGDLLARGLALVLFGSADGLYEDENGGQWGWDAAGQFHDTYLGGKAIAPFTTTREEPPANASRSILFFPPTNSPPAAIRVNTRGPEWSFFAGEAGVLCHLSVSEAKEGQQDQVHLKQSNGLLEGFGFSPSQPKVSFTPRLGILSSNLPSTVYQWDGLTLGDGQSADFIALRDTVGAEYRNGSGTVTSHRVRAIRNGADGPVTNLFGPFTVPPGAAHQVAFTGWPAPTLRSGLDENQDGTPETITFITPATGTNPPPPTLTAQNSGQGFTLTWPTDSAGWQLELTYDIGTTNILWKPIAEPPYESAGTVFVTLPTDQSRAFFRLRKME